ncbi:MAG: PAS domain S-box protein [Candidatus Kariarchaeaceae archaeon]
MINSSKKYKVLLVDDERGLLELGKNFLERYGNIKATTAVSSFEALSLIKLEDFDGIICDYQMPEMDGFELFQELRANDITIPFIIYTGKGREEIAIKALNMGVDRYVQKGKDLRSQYHVLAQAITQEIDHWIAQNALVEREERFRRMATNIYDGLTIIENNQIIYVNDRACEIFNIAHEDFLSLTSSVIFPEGSEVNNIIFNLQKEGKEFLELDYWIKVDNNTRKFVANRYSFFFENGNYTCYLVSTDSTERHLLNKAIKDERDRTKSYLNIAEVFMMVINTDHVIELINRKGCEIIGADECDIIGKNWLTFVKEEDKNEVRINIEKLLSREIENLEVERELVTRDTISRIINWNSKPIIDQNDEVQGILSSGKDITDLKRAEEGLKYRYSIEKLITNIIQRYSQINKDNIFEELNASLKDICKFLEADRSYIFLYSKDQTTFTKNFGWNSKNENENLTTANILTREDYPWLTEQILAGKTVNIPIITKLPEEAKGTRDIFLRDGVLSAFFIPIQRISSHKSEIGGYISFASVSKEKIWLKEDISMVSIISEAIYNTLERIKSEEIYNLRLEFEEKIIKLSGAFINAGIQEIDDGIRNTLKEISIIAGLDRGFLFILSKEKDQLYLTHGWHTKGYETLEDTFQTVDLELFNNMITKLNIFSEIAFVDLETYHKETDLIRKLTGEQVQTLTLIPLQFSDDSKGFFGFTANYVRKEWSKEEIIMLKMAEQMITSATEQKRSLIRLQEKEAQYSSLINSLNVGVYRSTAKPPGSFVSVNKAFAAILGYDSIDELLKINISDIYPDDTSREEVIKDVINSGEERGTILTLKKKDGSLVKIVASVRVVYDEFGVARWLDGVIDEVID